MKTIAFVARKGGVSKTTLAAHVAVAASADHTVRLVDADPQRSLSLWMEDRESDNLALLDVPVGRLVRELEKAKDVAGLVIVDTPAFDSGIVAAVIQVADLIVIPVRPSPHDLRGVAVTVEAVQKAGKPFLLIITQAVGGASLTTQAREVLKKSGRVAEAVMHSRVAYAGSMVDGRTVLEIDPHGKASTEITAIYNEVMKSLNQKVRAHNGR